MQEKAFRELTDSDKGKQPSNIPRWTEVKAACNKGIAASGAGRWSNWQQFAIRLLYRREVINLAFSFYLQPLVKTRQQFRAGRYKIPRLTAIPVRYVQPFLYTGCGCSQERT